MDNMEKRLRKYFAGLQTGETENKLVMACVYLIQAVDRTRGNYRLLEEVFCECIEKYARGAKKYGDFNPATDRRDLILEALQELIDAVNYLGMDECRLAMVEKEKPEVE